jgi:uncharacterized LabA/DUF88 family protein
MRTIIYVDGFNLYYGALKNTPFKWLNLKVLFTNLLRQENRIIKIKYFTARVSSTQSDANKANHQDAYLRALKHVIPEIEIHFGQFTTHNVRAKLVNPIAGQKYADVVRTNEKGSDVNLAVHLLNDAWLDSYDCAIMVSGDSDLAESIKLVKQHHRQKIIGLITMGKRGSSKELVQIVDFVKNISTTALSNSQLPPALEGTSITKPPDW